MTIAVRAPGIQTTVQDLGRPAWQRAGVPVGGAMDEQAHRIANLLVGNDADDAALDCALGGVALQFETDALLAITGRDITASIDGVPVPPWRALRARRGALLVVHNGCRTTIAVAGGILVPVVLDGRGTCLRGAFGGWNGRALRRDDRLPVGTAAPLAARIAAHLDARRSIVGDWSVGSALRPPYSSAPRVRLIAGPEHASLTPASREAFFGDTFRIAPESDRMGYRLSGPSLALTENRDMVSSGVTAGTIQLPPGGAPIVLMADRQTTGGYPRLGDVIAVDLPLLAQLQPGDHVAFAAATLDEAHTLLRQREHDLARATRAMHHRFAGGADGAR
jgi:antagonist of KipI